MTPLKNAKHEAFARAIVEGSSQRDAYRNAGYQPKTDEAADACASRLLGDAKVSARIDELKKAAAEGTVLTAQRVLDELGKIGFSNFGDFYRLVAGDPAIDLSNLTREQQAAIAEVTVEDYKDGRGEDARDVRKIKIKLHDKLGALTKLGEHFKLFTQKHEHTGKDGKPMEVDVTELTPVQRARRIAFALAKAKRATKDGAST